MKMWRRLRFFLPVFFLWCTNASPESDFETVRTSNAAILNRLGLVPLEIPDGHHKKRLAGPEPPELSHPQTRLHQPYSRRHGHRDSHVYVVKLPASPPYYTITKPHKSPPKDDKLSSKMATSINGLSPSVVHQSSSVGFHSNGKPAKIYHWNLPVMKKIGEKKRLHAQFRMDQLRKKLASEKIMETNKLLRHNNSLNVPMKLLKSDDNLNRLSSNSLPNQSPIKHTRNNDKILNYPDESSRANGIVDKINGTHKMFRLEDSMLYHLADNSKDRLNTWISNDLHGMKTSGLQKPKKHRKKAAMSYYAPITAKTGSTSIHKNFPGNGKPKAFYVMEKSRKPVYYHPLLP
ncbi:uncharacterized protein [Fopius arisanus]|uniref:Uncharacterized protein n=1 Tax=Fopius arisanus TaxID=64838 RepID=A0A0C9R1W3_9HYME|nr:PREDICTED: uncharacterized protein LOC105271294 [Fopius arisanus]